MAGAVGGRPRGVLVGERVGVVGNVAAADVFVAQIAADEALLFFRARDPADAADGRQVEEPLVIGIGVFPHEQGGVLEVVRGQKANQRLVAGGSRPAQREQRHRALAGASLAIEEAHPHLGTRVTADVAVLDLASDLVGGQTPSVTGACPRYKADQGREEGPRQPSHGVLEIL